MKKLMLFFVLATAFTLQFCSSARKAQKEVPKVSYATNVQPVISSNCGPCHIPPGGKITALNTYASAKENIDSIIVRIQRNPNEKGFMPFKHPKLPDST